MRPALWPARRPRVHALQVVPRGESQAKISATKSLTGHLLGATAAQARAQGQVTDARLVSSGGRGLLIVNAHPIGRAEVVRSPVGGSNIVSTHAHQVISPWPPLAPMTRTIGRHPGTAREGLRALVRDSSLPQPIGAPRALAGIAQSAPLNSSRRRETEPIKVPKATERDFQSTIPGRDGQAGTSDWCYRSHQGARQSHRSQPQGSDTHRPRLRRSGPRSSVRATSDGHSLCPGAIRSVACCVQLLVEGRRVDRPVNPRAKRLG